MTTRTQGPRATGWLRGARSLLRVESSATPGAVRFAAVVQGAVSALGVQGVGVFVGLVSVPLAVGYLGAERYGAWVTIGSIIAWLSVADLGLGNELTNALSSARARAEAEAREVVASAFWGLAAVSAIVLALGTVAWSLVDWPALMNVRSPESAREIGPAVGLAFAFFCAGLPLTLSERVLVTIQRGAIHNAWAVASSVASLAAIVAAIRLRGGLVTLVTTTAGIGFTMRLASTAWLYWRYEPNLRPGWRAFRPRLAWRLFGRGKDFFLVQIGALVLYSTDNIIIARILGPTEVTPYAVAWRLFTVPNLILTAAFPYLWAAYADAMARRDTAWAVRTLRVSTIAATTLAVGLALPLALTGRDLIRIWAGAAAVPPWPVLAWMCVWSAVLAPANSAVCFLNASGVVRWQVWIGSLTAAANVGLSILWARSYGISGVIAATVVSYVAVGVTPLAVVVRRVVRGLTSDGIPAD